MGMFTILITVGTPETSIDSISQRLDNEDLNHGTARIGAEAVHLMTRIAPIRNDDRPIIIAEIVMGKDVKESDKNDQRICKMKAGRLLISKTKHTERAEITETIG